MYQLTHVDGKDAGKIVLYALSTCIWCRKTKKILNHLGLAYDYVDVDLLSKGDGDLAEKEIEKWNPQLSFPTIIIDDKQSIVGFHENELNKLGK